MLPIFVLILLLMEYGLGHTMGMVVFVMTLRCLNPSFNGIWSRTLVSAYPVNSEFFQVLILLLMEYGLGLRVKTPSHTETTDRVLILLLMEYGLGLLIPLISGCRSR